MEKEITVEDVTIDVGWGKLRGKQWHVQGDVDFSIKILAIHGHLDNINSFEPLIQHLPPGTTILALDSPGQGLSDHLPRGARYDFFSIVVSLREALKKINWNSFILLGHSYGGFVSVFFSALLHELVRGLIIIDVLAPWYDEGPDDRIQVWLNDIRLHERSELKNKSSPRGYTEEEILNLMISSRLGLRSEETTVAEEAARLLLLRTARLNDDKYTWTYDPKARTKFISVIGLDNYFYCLQNIKCPIIVILGSEGTMYNSLYTKERTDYVFDLRQRFLSYAPNTDINVVEGTHYVHMTNPGRVAPWINNFILNVDYNQCDDTKAKL